jgi:hypothetical protein
MDFDTDGPAADTAKKESNYTVLTKEQMLKEQTDQINRIAELFEVCIHFHGKQPIFSSFFFRFGFFVDLHSSTPTDRTLRLLGSSGNCAPAAHIYEMERGSFD